ncbi:phosphonate metabolism transcriptional regulator PhnF [Microlunatus endophyticus]|uniref:Phosphonate metabolism transcriptional regulator PhnF n=1 Tax=Microlunatus endophyticus TaxID=1716077 RepID=A0A917S298_9ACTN|nr:phosphonate metabolism transcriptional regulator PhnF [Microlunatus endophyticus]GGL49200.1 phosphonate metabolism transcriptional regulator PhnF [Microlunatus endophyticus]
MSQITRPSTGYAAWRLIAEELRADIVEGRLGTGARLPSENELAQRFGVNRQTARQAVTALAGEGLVEARRGSGTFVTGAPVHVHRIGVRTRLSSSLGPSAGPATGRVLDHARERPPAGIAARLQPLGELAIRVETLRIVGGKPLSRGTHWFDPARVPDIVANLRRTSSVTAALRAAGIHDYVRLSTLVSARHATAAEVVELELEPGSVVLVTDSVDALVDQTPLQVGISRFAAARMALDIEHS